jgi:hypothetical protein
MSLVAHQLLKPFYMEFSNFKEKLEEQGILIGNQESL